MVTIKQMEMEEKVKNGKSQKNEKTSWKKKLFSTNLI